MPRPSEGTTRASDADRDAVVARLQDALADGRIDFDEFEKRMAAASTGRTLGALAPLTVDLPEVRHQPREPLALRTKGSRIVRAGNWRPPHEITVEAKLGKVVLDFTAADWPGPEVAVLATIAHCTLEVIVSADTDVDTDAVELHFSSVKVRGDVSTDVRRWLRIRGRAQHGKILVRRPRVSKGLFRRPS